MILTCFILFIQNPHYCFAVVTETAGSGDDEVEKFWGRENVNDSDEIPELVGSKRKRVKATPSDILQSLPTTSADSDGPTGLPTLINIYTDPDTMNDEVTVVLALPSGVVNYKLTMGDPFETNGGTDYFSIEYDWPRTFTDMSDLFKRKLKGANFTLHHPKVLGIMAELENYRENVDQKPKSSFQISLPISVQSSMETVVQEGLKRPYDDGSVCMVLMLTFKVFEKNI